MDMKNSYFWCIVPMCTNTSIKTPDKVFIHVPKQPNERKLWLRAARRDPKEVSPTSSLYCCEDHFDLQNDMENWVKFNLLGRQTKKIMKKNVVPHKFKYLDNLQRARSIPVLTEEQVESSKSDFTSLDVAMQTNVKPIPVDVKQELPREYFAIMKTSTPARSCTSLHSEMNISMNEEPTEITVKHEIKEESYCTEYQIPTISALPKDETNKLVIKEEPMDDDELYPFVKVDVNESFPIKTELSNDDPLIKAEPNETLPFIQTETISAGEIVIKEEPTDEKVVYPSNNAVSKINSRTIRAQMLSKNFLVRVIKSYKIQEITLRCQIRNLWREKHRLQNLLRRRNLLGSKGRKPARKLKANYKKYGSPSRKS